MAGVTHIQVTTTLHFSDGYVVTLATPLWHKDIRTGDFFSNELTCEVVQNGGRALAEMIEQTTLQGIHHAAIARDAKQTPLPNRIRPGPFDSFSLN
jgi:hypothetical protein